VNASPGPVLAANLTGLDDATLAATFTKRNSS